MPLRTKTIRRGMIQSDPLTNTRNFSLQKIIPTLKIFNLSHDTVKSEGRFVMNSRKLRAKMILWAILRESLSVRTRLCGGALLLIGISAATASPVLKSSDTQLLEIQQGLLQEYGFTYCLIQRTAEKSELREEAAASRRRVFNTAHYIIVQNDDLDILHDPYESADSAMHSEMSRSLHAEGQSTIAYCFELASSENFLNFVVSQNQYIAKHD